MGAKEAPPPFALVRQREEIAWRLAAKGYTHDKIAEELGVERSTVTKMLHRVEKRAVAKMDGEVKEEKVRQLAVLHVVQDEAMVAFEESKKPEQTVEQKESGNSKGGDDDGGKSIETKKKVTTKTGDPAYLDRAMEASTQIRKLLGLDAPQKTAYTNPTGDAEAQSVIIVMPDNGRGDGDSEAIKLLDTKQPK